MKIWFTVDMEDWYQGIGLPQPQWTAFEKRIRIGHDKLLALLSRHSVKATYFILGKVTEEFPNLVREVQQEGHELACHTYSHPFLYSVRPEAFRAELRLCKELIAPYQEGFKGFRAPYFSIDKRNFWALDVLKDEGFIYDSSIFPGTTVRTGIPGFSKDIHLLDNGMIEFPISNFKIMKFDVGVGGAYFRILPYRLFRSKIETLLRERPILFYIHPWELDPDHPRLTNLDKRVQYTHYFNLKSTEHKLGRFLAEFAFCSPNELFT